MEEKTRKIGEVSIYRDVVDVVYPGEEVHVKIILWDDKPPETVYLVKPIPGWRGRFLRWRWLLWGRFHADGPARMEVKLGESWFPPDDSGPSPQS